MKKRNRLKYSVYTCAAIVFMCSFFILGVQKTTDNDTDPASAVQVFSPEPTEYDLSMFKPDYTRSPAERETILSAADSVESDTAVQTEIPQKNTLVYNEKFDPLREYYGWNEELIGVVKIPGTPVHFPVMHNPADTEYYLSRTPNRVKSSAGSITLDFENSVERHDPNTILYGHQMTYSGMFHPISYYNDESYFREHRYVIFSTIYEDTVWEVFTFFKAHVSFQYIQVYFKSEDSFLNLASQMKTYSMYENDVQVGYGDRILTLSTCTNINNDERYVLSARLIKNADEIPDEIKNELVRVVEDVPPQ
ncbi:hypothetical protein FACS1894219_07110 [Clostridia bacterium]|nr:hypothetical protein FACS1894219_07110 [Clostridia bacterium]